MATRNDGRWVAGIFYYNLEDPDLWVEKRFGIGWTLNFARPASWLMLLGLLIPVAAVGVLVWLTHRAIHLR
jgi:uncharacterized membrane protein